LSIDQDKEVISNSYWVRNSLWTENIEAMSLGTKSPLIDVPQVSNTLMKKLQTVSRISNM